MTTICAQKQHFAYPFTPELSNIQAQITAVVTHKSCLIGENDKYFAKNKNKSDSGTDELLTVIRTGTGD